MSNTKTYPIRLNKTINSETESETRTNKVVKYIRQGKGMCFNYALKNQDLCYTEDGFQLLEVEYKRIKIEKAKKGDIITIHDVDKKYDEYLVYTCQHFVIIKEIKKHLRNIIIRSKWGGWAIYEGKLKDLPIIYGNTILIWRKRK